MKDHLNSLSPAEQEALSYFVSSLRAHCGDNVTKMVLFGSRARGEGTESSDIDVLIVLRGHDHRLRREILDCAADLFMEQEINVSPLVMTAEHFAWLRSIERGIALEIERDGVEL